MASIVRFIIAIIAALGISYLALGGCSSNEELISVNTEREIPEIDRNMPADYETATFSMG